MDTRDVRNPQDTPKGTISGNNKPRGTVPHAERVTHTHEKTESIVSRQSKKKSGALLLLSHAKRQIHRPIPLGFIVSACVVGVLGLTGMLVLTLAARQAKTVDFYTQEATASAHRMVEGAQLFANHKFAESKDRFTQAKSTLTSIDRELWFIPISDATNFAVDKRMYSVRAAVKAALELATAGEEASIVAQKILARVTPPAPPKANDATSSNSYVEKTSTDTITGVLVEAKPEFESLASHLQAATNYIHNIPLEVLPNDFKDEFGKAQHALNLISDLTVQTLSHFSGITEFLGHTKPHTILVVLQNASELRPTGGFIGNLAFVEFDKGQLTQQSVHDIYSFDHKLKENITPPDEIKLINSRWFLRDSNASLDFPTSANSIASFLKKEGGPEVDTIVTVDQNVIKNILDVVGPLKIDELEAPLTAANFEQVLSFIVEAKIYGREDPKILLKSLLPALQKTTLNSGKLFEVVKVLREAVTTKHIMAYSKNGNVTDLIADLHAAGLARANFPENKADFFALAHYSIGGNKSDLYMKESITHDTFIAQNGELIDEVTITRTNTWNGKIEKKLTDTLAQFGFKDIPPNVLAILGKTFNVHMLRLYAPLGSVLVGNTNPNITTHVDDAMHATYFSVRMEVAPNDSNTIKLRYTLPFTLGEEKGFFTPTSSDIYRLDVVAQPGQDAVNFEKRYFPDSGIRLTHGGNESGVLATDRTIEATFTR